MYVYTYICYMYYNIYNDLLIIFALLLYLQSATEMAYYLKILDTTPCGRLACGTFIENMCF